MPSRHSKNSGDKHHFTYHEKHKAGMGSIKQRLGADSQLPFGYCAISMYPAEDAVISPSGHLYSRESILEYLLSTSRKMKRQQQQYDEQQFRLEMERKEQQRKEKEEEELRFLAATDVIEKVKRTIDEVEPSNSEYFESRKKLIDDSERQKNIEELKRISPWVPQFTPEAKESTIVEPPKRPPSPFSGRPLRAKDLVSINLVKESTGPDDRVRFICPLSRKTITNQKVVVIRSTGAYMLEQEAKEFAYPTQICPLSGKRFAMEDVVTLVQASSGFSATGPVEIRVHRPTLN